MAAPRNIACHLISFFFILGLGLPASAHRHLKEIEQDTMSAAPPLAGPDGVGQGGCAPEPSPSTEITQAAPCAPQTSSNGDSHGAPGAGAGAGPQAGWGGFGVPTYGAQGGVVLGFPGFGWPGIGIGIPPISISGGPAGISIGGVGVQLGGGFFGGNICYTPGLGFSYCFTPGVIGGAVNGGGRGPLTNYPPLTGACGQAQPVSPGVQMYPPPPPDCGQAQPVSQGGQLYPPPPPDCGQAQPVSQGGQMYPPPPPDCGQAPPVSPSGQMYPPPAADCGQAQPVSPGGQMNSNAAPPEVFEVSEEDNQFN